MASNAVLARERKIVLKLLVVRPASAIWARQHADDNRVFDELLGFHRRLPRLAFYTGEAPARTHESREQEEDSFHFSVSLIGQCA